MLKLGMDFTYFVILVLVLVISPFALKIASKQSSEIKQTLRIIYILMLSAQILSGFFNWENFTIGRSGFELSLTYQNSLLGFFFVIAAIQVILLLLNEHVLSFGNKSFNILIVFLSFINSVSIFIGMIKLSNSLGFQIVSFASILAVFLVLTGNIIGLVFINKDKNLLKKYVK